MGVVPVADAADGTMAEPVPVVDSAVGQATREAIDDETGESVTSDDSSAGATQETYDVETGLQLYSTGAPEPQRGPVEVGGVYGSTLSSTYTGLAEGVLRHVQGYGDHYILWRYGSYSYSLAVGDLEWNGSRVSGSADVYRWTIDGGHGSDVRQDVSYDESISLAPGGYVVWSDIAPGPALDTSGSLLLAVLVLAAVVTVGVWTMHRAWMWAVRLRGESRAR